MRTSSYSAAFRSGMAEAASLAGGVGGESSMNWSSGSGSGPRRTSPYLRSRLIGFPAPHGGGTAQKTCPIEGPV